MPGVEQKFLERCLVDGLSLEAIGKRVAKHPSTVSYWLKKYGLAASKARSHAPKGPLSRSDLEELVQTGLTLREIADRLDRSTTTIRYWLRKYDLRLRRSRRSRVPEELRREVFKCRRHGETTFVLEGRGYYRCAACRAERVGGWRREVKRRLVEEAGGKCVACGYSRCQRALEFHHLDPATKEFHLGMNGVTRSFSKSRREAHKCALLCANCHAEVEAGLIELPVNSNGVVQSGVVHSD
jgi:transposase